MINPTITVGIPNYNGARYLRMAIESVLKQSYKDFEIIITDDGSTDNSIEILKEYQNHPKVRVIKSEENRGLSFWLNQQIRLARGKFFCRMDSDDIMFPDRLEKQFNFMKSFSDVDVVGSAAVVIDENNMVIGTRALINNEEYSRPCSGFIHPTVMGKTSFFRDHLYSEIYSGAEDTELWMRCRELAVFKVINEPLLFYRDPLKLRVGTYISRLTLIEKLFKDMCSTNKLSKMSYIFAISRLQYQKIAVRILERFGLTSIWVKRRNSQCSSEQFKRYQSILDEQAIPTHTY